MHFERFDIVQVLRSSVNSATLLAEQKDAEILFYETEPVYVWADEYMIEEVITNYISNAVNHVDGERVIRVTMEQRGDVERISVRRYRRKNLIRYGSSFIRWIRRVPEPMEATELDCRLSKRSWIL